MRVGKTGVRRCNQCGKPLPPKHTVILPNEGSDEEVHLCPGMQCPEEWSLEGPLREKAERAQRAEIKEVWDRICPADRERLRELI